MKRLTDSFELYLSKLALFILTRAKTELSRLKHTFGFYEAINAESKSDCISFIHSFINSILVHALFQQKMPEMQAFSSGKNPYFIRVKLTEIKRNQRFLAILIFQMSQDFRQLSRQRIIGFRKGIVLIALLQVLPINYVGSQPFLVKGD